MKLLVRFAVTAANLLSLAVGVYGGDVESRGVTILFGDSAVDIEAALVDGDHLWLAKEDVVKASGYEPKPEGFCLGEICVPIPSTDEWSRSVDGRQYYCVSRFAEKVDQAVVADDSRAVWSFGAVPMPGGGTLEGGMAPDFELPDREGNMVRLSDFRGKKVLLLTWASW